MNSFRQSKNIASWIVFAIAFIVYYFSAERTGSLWDCGEFILGALKLQVVHPPGAPLYLLIGRLFTWFAEILSNNPSDIAFSINLMSSMCTAFAAFFIARITMMFGKSIMKVNDEPSKGQNIAIMLAGIVAGLSTAFASSIWFSAVEGEVYAMSTFFTALTFWAATKWYFLPDNKQSDRWLILCIYFGALSIGVHLLSLLTFPAIGLMVYFKKYKKRSFLGVIGGLAGGAAVVVFIQKLVIVGIPTIWKNFELFMVNSLGMPFHSGLILTLLVLGGLFYFLFKYSNQKNNYLLQFITMSALMIVVAFSTIGIVVIRANADTPINMNVPSDAMRLLPYLNREQYGERPLLYGPHFDASPKELVEEERYGRVGDRYEIIDKKLSYKFASKDKMLFPRVGHSDPGRPQLHREWYEAINGKKMRGKPSFGYNIQYFLNYQIGWMYFRYFMWNFSGRQNGSQGYKAWDKSSGHWITGIKAIDEAKLYNMDEITDTMKAHQATNKYYMLPFIFGLIGLFFMAKRRPDEFGIIFILFLVTGIGIILYSNQPPNEPRERDYVLVGSFMAFAIWIGMAVIAIFEMVKEKLNGKSIAPALVLGSLVLIAPILMAFENFDDHSRKDHYGSRDYASNFLNSVEENAIIFTYGDNDTYPLWYAQEVENIRRDVRVVNLSLIAVDWYINKLRSKVNDSAPLKLTLSEDAYRGNKRNQIFFYDPSKDQGDDLLYPTNIFEEFKFIGNKKNNTKGQTISRTRSLYIPIDAQKAKRSGLSLPSDTTMVDRINIKFPKSKNYLTKDELAVMDVIISNIYDRPIYFAVTCKNEKLLGLNDYMDIEGLGLRLSTTKVKSDKSLSIYGSGEVDTDRMYRNVMEKWRWGNFDKKELYVDRSYGAEIQAMKLVMMRLTRQLFIEGKREKAANVANKYFEAFPHFNFAYDNTVVPFIETLINAGDFEAGKKHLRILANETAQQITFFESIDEKIFESSFRADFSYAIRAVSEILELSKKTNDSAFNKEMIDLVGKYDISKIRRD